LKRVSRLDLLVSIRQRGIFAAEVNAGRVVGGPGAGDDDVRSTADGQRVAGKADDAAHQGAAGVAAEADLVGNDGTVEHSEVAGEVGLETLGKDKGSGQLAQVAVGFGERADWLRVDAAAEVQDVGGQVADG